jgi:hypothetical protein
MTPTRWLALSLAMLSGCVTAPSPKPTPPLLPARRAVPSVPIQRVSAEAPPAQGNSSVIGKRELLEARELLDRARGELEPQQWALLDTRLREAEQAFQAFSVAATAAGRAAVVARGAETAVEAGRAGEVVEGIARSLPRTGGLLLLLGILWPSETADAAHDHGPDWNPAEQEFKAKLWALAQAGHQVRAELAAREAQRGQVGSKAAPSAQPLGLPVEAGKQKVPKWKQDCINAYTDCVNDRWVQKWSCNDCLRYCIAQQEWPVEQCHRER